MNAVTTSERFRPHECGRHEQSIGQCFQQAQELGGHGFVGFVSSFKGGQHEFAVDLASLNIDLTEVTTLAIGFERTGDTGGSGTVFLDDIQLRAIRVE